MGVWPSLANRASLVLRDRRPPTAPGYVSSTGALAIMDVSSLSPGRLDDLSNTVCVCMCVCASGRICGLSSHVPRSRLRPGRGGFFPFCSFCSHPSDGVEFIGLVVELLVREIDKLQTQKLIAKYCARLHFGCTLNEHLKIIELLVFVEVTSCFGTILFVLPHVLCLRKRRIFRQQMSVAFAKRLI